MFYLIENGPTSEHSSSVWRCEDIDAVAKIVSVSSSDILSSLSRLQRWDSADRRYALFCVEP